MIYLRDGVWSSVCDRCLAMLPTMTGTRVDVDALVIAALWELVDRDMCWCVECSRRAREVKMPRKRPKRSRR